jgi:hypothetical protein
MSQWMFNLNVGSEQAVPEIIPLNSAKAVCCWVLLLDTFKAS